MLTDRSINDILNLLEPNTIVQHFKRDFPHVDKLYGLYQIIGVAKIEAERNEHVVVYKSLSNGQLWTRSVENFISETPESYSKLQKTQTYRFEVYKGSDEEVAQITIPFSQNNSFIYDPKTFNPKNGGDCNDS